jgi:hypothetical protein
MAVLLCWVSFVLNGTNNPFMLNESVLMVANNPFKLNVIIPSVVAPFQEKLSLLAILENDGTLTSCAPFHKLFTTVIYNCRMAKPYSVFSTMQFLY